MDKLIEELVAKLHPLERKILPFLKDGLDEKELSRLSGLKEVEVVRAMQWLENKGVLKIEPKEEDTVQLGKNGEIYLKEGLPEMKYLEIIKDKPLTVKEIIAKKIISPQEVGASTGLLKSKVAIEMKDGKVSITEQGKKLLSKEPIEMKFLKNIAENGISFKKIKDENKLAYDNLMKRKDILVKLTVKSKLIKLTDLGKKLSKVKIKEGGIVDTLTSKMLKEGTWKGKKFRNYDIKINVPKITAGRRHFENEVIEYVKRIWTDLGFEEMSGSLVQTSLWNFDALFTPQDHPVRDEQDTFFIKDPKEGKIGNKKIANAIKETHENGWTTGSTGWKYKWSEEEAKKNVLRTHTTCLSAQTISKLKESDLPKKFFSVGRVFRNETLDYSHLFEFYQVEGIVVDENVNFRHLIGYLVEFFKKMGFDKIRVRPAYFPYTEPSAEVDVYDEERKEWLELGGAGVFRPEIVKPLLGKEVPVLAWGMGLGRILMRYYQLKDIRDINKNDLKQLREIKAWMK